MSDFSKSSALSKAFEGEAAPADIAPRCKQRRPAPFSLRLSEEERARLLEYAGQQPLGAYIRSCLPLGEAQTKRRKSPRRPSVDEAAIAKALSILGASRLASNLNQLAHSANVGRLSASGRTEKMLEQACADVAAMRAALIQALGLTPEGE